MNHGSAAEDAPRRGRLVLGSRRPSVLTQRCHHEATTVSPQSTLACPPHWSSTVTKHGDWTHDTTKIAATTPDRCEGFLQVGHQDAACPNSRRCWSCSPRIHHHLVEAHTLVVLHLLSDEDLDWLPATLCLLGERVATWVVMTPATSRPWNILNFIAPERRFETAVDTWSFGDACRRPYLLVSSSSHITCLHRLCD